MKIWQAISTILLLIPLTYAAPSSNETGRDASSPEQHEVTVMADGADDEVLSDDILSNEIPRTLDNDPIPKTDRTSFFKFAKPSSFMDDLAAATPYASTTPSSDEVTSTTTTVSSTQAAETTTSSPTTTETTEPPLDDLSVGFGKLIDSLFRSALESIFHLPTGMMDSNSRSLPPTRSSQFNSHIHHFSSPSTRRFFHFGRTFWM